MAMDQLEGRKVLRPKVLADAEEPLITKLSNEGETAGLESVFITKEGKSGKSIANHGMTSKVVERHRNKTHVMRKFEHVIKWLCGLWAFGIGFRFTIELLASEGWIHMPNHPLNIWFDFFPLCILGLLVVFFEVRNLISIACTEQQVSEDVVQV